MGRVWLVELPIQAGFCLYSRTHPTFGGGGTRRMYRSEDNFVESVSPTFSRVPGSMSFPQLALQAQTEASPQPTAGFCLAMGAPAPWELLPRWLGFLFGGIPVCWEQAAGRCGLSVLCTDTGVTFPPSLLCLSDFILPPGTACSEIFSLLLRPTV